MSVTPTNTKLTTAELLYERAQAMGLDPAWVTPRGLIAITKGGKESYINLARSPLNSHTSSSLANNKYLTRVILERHGLRNIPFARLRSLTDARAFLAKHETIIAKPIKGAGAHGIHVITEASQLDRLHLRGYMLEKYIAGPEIRYLVLNNEVIAVHRSDYGTSVEADRPLKRISYPVEMWDDALASTSREIARILGLQFAAVDFIIDSTGQAHILEVNTNPGLKWFHSPSSGPIVDVATMFLNALMEQEPAQSYIVRPAVIAVASTSTATNEHLTASTTIASTDLS